MKLYLVRHGETIWNATGRCQGHSDVPLSDHGRRQAQALSNRLVGIAFAAAWCSDLCRATETARILVAGRGLTPQEDPRLREIALGEWEGLLLAEVAERYPDARRRWLEDPGGHTVPGGESLSQVQRRVAAALDDLRQRHQGEHVLVVSHGFATLSYLCHVLELPLATFRRLWLDPTGVSEVRFGRRGAVLARLNDTAHLETLRERSADPSE